MMKRINLYLKKTTYEHLMELAAESGINNLRVYIVKKLITPYARRIDSAREHAANPIPNKLVFASQNTVKDHIVINETELAMLQRLIYYHYFIDSRTGKPRYSLFIACLIEHAYSKKNSGKKSDLKSSTEEADYFDYFAV